MAAIDDVDSVVTLPMYDLPEVRSSTSLVLDAIASNLCEAGWAVRSVFRDFADHRALVKHWLDPDTALSHSCGLPFLEELGAEVQVLGTFLWRGVSAHNGRYRSVLLVRADDPRTIDDLTGAQPVINNPESLSGWCSLGAALHDRGYTAADFPTMIRSGGHARSIDAVTAGAADLAAVDGATFRLLQRHRPSVVERVRVIGFGPEVPATPLITRSHTPIDLAAVRAALEAAVAEESNTHACEVLGIEGVALLTQDDYTPILELTTKAEATLPRGRSTVG